MAKKQKYYVVWEGNNTGVFDSWTKCQLQIKGYPNAKYKAFKSKAEAEAAYNGNLDDFIGNNKKEKRVISEEARQNIIWKSIAVDAACSGNPGVMEYRGVDTIDGRELFKQGPYNSGTNNIGEFLALVHALAYLKKEDHLHLPIYSDSRTAMSWVKHKRVKTSLARNRNNKILFDLVDRAITWLKKNEYKNPILKWETKEWGEIPADFGRK